MKLSPIKPLQADYLRSLTDDTGIFQHTKFGVPDRGHGYTSDDNGRALIAAVLLHRNHPGEDWLRLAGTYLSFIHHAQNEDGSFRNFMNYNRSFAEPVGSEDCLGRCIWALGFALSEPTVPDNLQNTCRFMIDRALPRIAELRSPRAIAYALVGLAYMLETKDSLHYAFPYPYTDKSKEAESFLPHREIRELIERMADRLLAQFEQYATTDWQWFEDSVTYGNAMLPWALLKAARLSGRADLRYTAKASLAFLTSHTFSKEGYFKPVGSHGWLVRGETAAPYDEQPIEACETLLALYEAYDMLGTPSYLEHAHLCLDWFHGRNSAGLPLIDPQTGGCYDGILASGLNLNQGSENIVSYCIAHSVIHHA
ncbi:glycosyltransferase [Cohnella sp. GCM10012308]|uniref:glycosyltransferase n=1 Tax=Cohnella sp. GCM10012308 TaxID=3317329 RepID=UPI003618EE7B